MIFTKCAHLHLQTTQFFEARRDSVRRVGFFPTKDPNKLNNCKQYFWINPEGSTTHCVYMNPLEESFREDLILKHFISHSIKFIGRQRLGFNILSRDAPWDYKLGLSNGITINIEITSLTDRRDFFRKLTAEELVQRHAYYPEIRLGILEKISKLFPDSELTKLIEGYKAGGKTKSDDVKNPYYPEKAKLFSSFDVETPLLVYDELNKAISKKMAKKHAGKSETILIIDNRTSTADIHDFIVAYQENKNLIEWAEFPEIWLYTGYGGDRKNRWEEALLLPLKLPNEASSKYLKHRFRTRDVD